MTDTVNLSTDPFEKYDWEGHLIQASGLVKILYIVARDLEDSALQGGLISLSNAIEDQITMAINKVPDKRPAVATPGERE